MSRRSLLNNFIKAEGILAIHNEVIPVIEAAQGGIGKLVEQIVFNCFEITVDAEKQVLLLEDVLDGEDTGAEEFTFEEFLGFIAEKGK